METSATLTEVKGNAENNCTSHINSTDSLRGLDKCYSNAILR